MVPRDVFKLRSSGSLAQVQEIHRQYYEEGVGRRDVMIVAHGHFNRVMISRWIQFPIGLGTHFNVEPAGVSTSLPIFAPVH